MSKLSSLLASLSAITAGWMLGDYIKNKEIEYIALFIFMFCISASVYIIARNQEENKRNENK